MATVEGLAADLTAVSGNADPVNVALPSVASLTVGDVMSVVSHGMINFAERAVSSSEGIVFDHADWLDAVAETARARADSDQEVVGIGGHSHEVVDEVHEGVLVLIPDSATGVGPAEGRTSMLTVSVTDGEITVAVHDH